MSGWDSDETYCSDAETIQNTCIRNNSSQIRRSLRSTSQTMLYDGYLISKRERIDKKARCKKSKQNNKCSEKNILKVTKLKNQLVEIKEMCKVILNLQAFQISSITAIQSKLMDISSTRMTCSCKIVSKNSELDLLTKINEFKEKNNEISMDCGVANENHKLNSNDETTPTIQNNELNVDVGNSIQLNTKSRHENLETSRSDILCTKIDNSISNICTNNCEKPENINSVNHSNTKHLAPMEKLEPKNTLQTYCQKRYRDFTFLNNIEKINSGKKAGSLLDIKMNVKETQNNFNTNYNSIDANFWKDPNSQIPREWLNDFNKW